MDDGFITCFLSYNKKGNAIRSRLEEAIIEPEGRIFLFHFRNEIIFSVITGQKAFGFLTD